jgi:hypothetical protein
MGLPVSRARRRHPQEDSELQIFSGESGGQVMLRKHVIVVQIPRQT